MHIKQKKSLKKIIITLCSILVVGGFFSTYLLYKQHISPEIPATPATISTEKGGEQNSPKGDFDNNKSQKTENSSKTPANNDSTQTQPATSSLSVIPVTSRGHVRVTTEIPTLWSTGTCFLTLTSGQTVITKDASIQALSSYSTCKGFDVDLQNGNWNATVTATNGSQTLTGTKDFVIQ